jgi:hypothetical protein
MRFRREAGFVGTRLLLTMSSGVTGISIAGRRTASPAEPVPTSNIYMMSRAGFVSGTAEVDISSKVLEPTQGRASRSAKFYCGNATVVRTCATIKTTKAGTVSIQIKNQPRGGSQCHLTVPSTVPDRPSVRVTDVATIDSLTSESITFESDGNAKTFAAGTRLNLQCIRGPNVPPGGDAGIGGFLYYQ